MDGTVEYMAFCAWLLSLGLMFSRFVCVSTWISTSLFLVVDAFIC